MDYEVIRNAWGPEDREKYSTPLDRLPMQKNLDKNLTLGDLARYAGVSESTIKAAFRDHIGQGALAYFIGMKMAAAKVYIREGDYNLTQIADRLGYNSIHYFSRRFRLLYGMSPTEYARSIKAIGEE